MTCGVGVGYEPSAAVFPQPASVRQVPHVHHSDGHLLYHQLGHLAELDVQNSAHAPHAQMGPHRVHRLPSAASDAPPTSGLATASTGIGDILVITSH